MDWGGPVTQFPHRFAIFYFVNSRTGFVCSFVESFISLVYNEIPDLKSNPMSYGLSCSGRGKRPVSTPLYV